MAPNSTKDVIWLDVTKAEGTTQISIDRNTTILDLSSHELIHIDLSPLVECSNLDSLWLFDNKLRNIDLNPLAQCPKLRILRLSKNQLISIDLSPLESCQSLEELHLSRNMIKQINLDPLTDCSKLRIIGLAKNKITQLNLAPLSHCYKLQVIYIYKNRLAEINLAPLSQCSDLQQLWLYGNKLENIDLSPLAECPDMQLLWLSRNRLKVVDLSPIANWPKLQELHLSGNKFDRLDIKPLSNCSMLKEIYLSNNKLKNLDLRPLSKCERLQILHLNGNKLENLNFIYLSKCIDLQIINISNNKLMNIDLSIFKNSKKLQRLWLSNNEISEVDLDPLSQCQNLQELHLDQNRIENLDLSPLANCQSLQELLVYSNRIATMNLTSLVGCTKLQHLLLFKNKLEDIDLTPLAKCKDLRSFKVSENQLKKIDITPLSQCTKLQNLSLHENHFEHIDLSPLAQCIKLQYLSLSRNHFEHIDLSPLAQCIELQYLSLSRNHFEHIDLSPLAQCSKMEKLRISTNNLSSIDLTPLSNCVNLEHLLLDNNQLEEIDLTLLANCKNFDCLNLSNNRLKNIDISPLAYCLRLTFLDLSGNSLRRIDLSPLIQCKNLSELYLNRNYLESIDLLPLTHCIHLQEIGLFGNLLKHIDLSPLEDSSLKEIRISKNHLKEIDLKPLSRCPDLEVLHLGRNKFDVVNITPLYKCKNLKKLYISRPIQLMSYELEPDTELIPEAIKQLHDADLLLYGSLPPETQLYGKILVVGESEVGKSCLVWRLLNPDAPTTNNKPHHSTEGVEIHTLLLNGNVRASIWDFGGQIEQAHSHQMFFSDRGLYIFVFKPETWVNVRFSRWYEMFKKRREEGGYFVPVRTHLNDDPAKHWPALERNLIDTLSEESHGVNSNDENPICQTIYELDSLDGSGVSLFRNDLPHLMKLAGALSVHEIVGWTEIWEIINHLKPNNPNDMGILTHDYLKNKVIERIGNTDIVKSLGTIIDYMHFCGILVNLPLIPIKDEDQERLKTKRIILLNPELAGRVSWELHSLAARNMGILRGNLLRELMGKPLTLNFTKSQTGQKHSLLIHHSQVKAFLDFLEEGGVIMNCHKRLLFPFALPKELGDVKQKWEAYGHDIAIQLEWEENSAPIAPLERIFKKIDTRLNPVSVWECGCLGEFRKAPFSLLRLENISCRQEKKDNLKFRLHIRTRKNDLQISSNRMVLLASELANFERLGQIRCLEPKIVCPICYQPLIKSADGRYSCINPEHGHLNQETQKVSERCRDLILSQLPRGLDVLDDIRMGVQHLRNDHDQIFDEFGEMKSTQSTLADIMLSFGSEEHDVKIAIQNWQIIENNSTQVLSPLITLLNKYQAALDRSIEHLRLTKIDLIKLIQQINLPEKEKESFVQRVKNWLKKLPTELTTEILGNFLYENGPAILEILVRAFMTNR